MKKSLAGVLMLSAAPLAMSVALIAAPAFAQEAQDTPAAGPIEGQSPDQAAEPTGEILVTGSRIPQPNLTSISPITVVNSQDIRLQGVTRVEDLLNSLPQVFAGQASTLANGSDGTATVDLRGLGASRTLVLVNGRRLLPGDPGSSAADLNAIPEALIKRVEVLTGGASATYGADAVSGVVNFIMDTDFEGIRLDGQYSFYQHGNNNKLLPPLLDARTAAGFSGFDYPKGSVADGDTWNATLSIGAGFDDGRGHVTAYVGYRKVDAVTQNNRDYSACTIQNQSATALQCGGSSTSSPGNALLFNPGSTSSTFYQIGPNRTLLPGRTRYNFAPTNYFQRPDERYTAGMFAHYDINDSIKPYMEFMFMDDRSLAQIAPSGDFGNTLTINCDNPLMSAQQRGIICNPTNLINGFVGSFPLNAGTNPGPAPVNFIDPTTGATYNRGYFQLLKRNVEGGPRIADFEHTEYRGVVGTKGDLGKAWSYDAYYQYGRTVYAQTYLGEFSASRLTRALDVVDDPRVAGTQPICRSALDGTDPSCVPYDILGNNITPAAINYVSGTGLQRGIVSEQVASASFTGKLGEYGIKTPWADDGLAINIGAEYRKEKLELTVDQEFATGDLTGQGAPTLPISGNYSVRELFGELQVPLVHENFVYDLSFNGGYRYSDYKISNGRQFSTDTYKLGLEFAPIRDIRFRASYNRAVRAPNLQELFAVDHVALDGATDPCSDHVILASEAGCLAQGLHAGQTVTANPAGQYNGMVGGTQTLNPEKATTKSLGVIFQPSFAPHLAVSADYYTINVKQAIQGFGADAILAACTNDVNLLACGLIHRNPVGSLWLTPDGYVTDLQSNIGGVKTSGIDVNASYSTEFDGVGSFSANLVGTYITEYKINNGLSAEYNCVGLYGVTCSSLTSTPSAPTPRWRHKARLTWAAPFGLGLSLQWRYFGSVKVDYSSSDSALSAPGFFGFNAKIPAQSYFDLAATYKLFGHASFRLGVNNIFDKEPPLVTSGDASANFNACPTGPCNGNTYPAVYDALGRYIYMGVTLDF